MLVPEEMSKAHTHPRGLSNGVMLTFQKGGLVVVDMPGKTTQLLVAAIACAVMLATPTSAAPISDLMYLDGATLNLASDNDAQELFFDANGDGSLAPGDVIRGAMVVNTLNSTGANLGGATGNNEWTAVYSVQVVATVPVDDPEPFRPVNNDHGLFRIVFGPDPGFPGFLAGGWRFGSVRARLRVAALGHCMLWVMGERLTRLCSAVRRRAPGARLPV